MLATKINIGELDKEIIFLAPVYATGGSRPSTNENKIESWTETATVWGRVSPFKGNEAMIAERLTETHNIVVTVRQPEFTVNATMRVVFETRVYSIVSLTPREDRRRFFDVVAQLIDNEIWT